MFSDKETAYLASQTLAMIGTASKDQLQPDVAVVGFDFDGTYFHVGGYDISRTLKYKNIQTNPKVSLVVDDLVSMDPWCEVSRFTGSRTSPRTKDMSAPEPTSGSNRRKSGVEDSKRPARQ